METYFAMNKEIVRLLRISDEVDKQYAALRIEELERFSEECQKVRNVLLEALETIMDIGDKACRDIARAAIKKARGEE